MPFLVEQQEDCFVIKYKLDDYYNSNIKPFLQATAATGLLNKCSLVATPNETYYLFSFRATTLCTLREWLIVSDADDTPVDTRKYQYDYDESDEYEDEEEEEDDFEEEMQNMHKNGSNNSEESDLFSNEQEEEQQYKYKNKKSKNNPVKKREPTKKPDCEPLMQLISYKEAILLIHSLSAQLNSLRKRKITFYTFDLDSVFVINGNTFLILNPDLVMPINYAGLLTFVSPINKNNAFHCPEIANYSALPFNCHCNSVYYSFAALIIYCLFDTHLPRSDKRSDSKRSDSNNNRNNDNELREERELILSKLYGTKLYWFLLRCLEDISTNRQLLFI
jgi:hypothetical protein